MRTLLAIIKNIVTLCESRDFRVRINFEPSCLGSIKLLKAVRIIFKYTANELVQQFYREVK